MELSSKYKIIMKIKNTLFAFATLLILSSCKHEEVTDNTDPSIAKTIVNVSYGADPLQKIDVYLPANRSTTTTKVIILIHGGSWISGDKTDFNAIVDTLKKRMPDYALFNINYRLFGLLNNNVFPTQENDVKAAIEFINNNAATYHISKKFVLIGASAGGHLAMLQGFKNTMPVKVKAIVSFFGPSDMADMYNNPAPGTPPEGIAILLNGTPGTNPALYEQSSPVTFINATSPPTILLHGGTDDLVKPSQSVAVQNKLDAAGVINQYVFYPAAGHGDWDAATYADAFNKIQVFLAANVE